MKKTLWIIIILVILLIITMVIIYYPKPKNISNQNQIFYPQNNLNTESTPNPPNNPNTANTPSSKNLELDNIPLKENTCTSNSDCSKGLSCWYQTPTSQRPGISGTEKQPGVCTTLTMNSEE